MRAQKSDRKTVRENMPGNGERDKKGPEAAAPNLIGAERTAFRCILNSTYHGDCERHYSSLHKLMMFIVVILGAGAFGAEMGHIEWRGLSIAPILTFIATLAGTIDLVFDLDGRARLHISLKRKFFDLLARLEAGEDHKRIDEEIIRSFGDEPPPMHAANALAFNAAVDALDRPPGQKYHLTNWQSLMRHWWPYEANIFPTEDDLKKAGSRQAVTSDKLC